MKKYRSVIVAIFVVLGAVSCAPQYALQSDLDQLRQRHVYMLNSVNSYAKHLDEVVRLMVRTLPAHDFLQVVRRPFFTRYPGTRRLIEEKLEQFKRAGNVDKTTIALLTELMLVLYAHDTSDNLGKKQFCRVYRRVVKEGHTPDIFGKVTFRVTCVQKQMF